MTWWMLWDIESGNAVDGTQDPFEAGELWLTSIRDPNLVLDPDIDCDGDCCAKDECRFGLKGSPCAGDFGG